MQDIPAPKKRDYSGRVYKQRQCIDCPAVFVPQSSAQKRCPGCQRENTLKLKREDEARKRKAAYEPRYCADCGDELPAPAGSARPRVRCVPCAEVHRKADSRRRNKLWTDSPERKEYDAAWRSANPERVKASQKKYRTAHPEVEQRRRLASYGLTPEQFAAMLAEQGGVCALCSEPPDPEAAAGTARVLHIDHDHATGAVRALLCLRCNSGIGSLQDDPALLRKAADYIEHHAMLAAEAGDW